jgi:hypothetical protein
MRYGRQHDLSNTTALRKIRDRANIAEVADRQTICRRAVAARTPRRRITAMNQHPHQPIDNGTSLDRRSLLLGLAAAVVAPVSAFAARDGWEVGMQILAGTRLRDPNVLALVIGALERESGADTVKRLIAAVLKRDAGNIVDPFDDPAVESTARRFVEMAYTGEIPQADGRVAAIGFHQALAWQVLGFTKPPGVCGPGFGWWNQRPTTIG